MKEDPLGQNFEEGGNNLESNLQVVFSGILEKYFPPTKRGSSEELDAYFNQGDVFSNLIEEINSSLYDYGFYSHDDYEYKIEISCIKEGDINVVKLVVKDSANDKEIRYNLGTGTNPMKALRSAVTVLSSVPISGIPEHLRDIGFDNRPSLDGLRNAVSLLLDGISRGFRKPK